MFEKVATQVSFPKEEEKVLAFWDEINAFEKSLEIRKGARNTFFTMGRHLQRGCRTTGTCWPARSKT